MEEIDLPASDIGQYGHSCNDQSLLVFRVGLRRVVRVLLDGEIFKQLDEIRSVGVHLIVDIRNAESLDVLRFEAR